MKTQEIKVMVEATVPVGKYCHDCSKLGSNNDDSCTIFPTVFLGFDNIEESYLKCQACLEACAKSIDAQLLIGSSRKEKKCQQ